MQQIRHISIHVRIYEDVFRGEKIFYFKSLNENLNPLSLDEHIKNILENFLKKKRCSKV
jgi:hypothetical protein